MTVEARNFKTGNAKNRRAERSACGPDQSGWSRWQRTRPQRRVRSRRRRKAMKLRPILSLVALIALASICCPLCTLKTTTQKESELRTVRGTVVDKEETPVDTAVVYLKNAHSQDIITHLSGSDGTFRFSGLDINVDYEIHAEKDGVTSATLALHLKFRHAQGIRPDAEVGPQEKRQVSGAACVAPAFRLAPCGVDLAAGSMHPPERRKRYNSLLCSQGLRRNLLLCKLDLQ